MPPTTGRSDVARKKRCEVAKQSEEQARIVKAAVIEKYPQNAYVVESKNNIPLRRDMPYYPKIQGTKVRVINCDTLDAAMLLRNARDLLESKEDKNVFVLNFADVHTPGGGWRNGFRAQEQQLCYRTTLIETLEPRFYPMNELECIYSPNVVVFRENEHKGYSYMWCKKAYRLPVVSVCSMAATRGPGVDKSMIPPQYKDETERIIMKDKMRVVLRCAGHQYHKQLVLGAIGCGAFGHPPHEVAECWKNVLQEKEFGGWFEMVVFAVQDTGENFTIFKGVLHDLKIPSLKT
jgi:uncharacterized protein (TIGR02452 family)